MAKESHGKLQEPQINLVDGSIPFISLPHHHDPDFENLTYGDPWGRLESFEKDDIAWFIESGTLEKDDWGYYIVAYFMIEDVYFKKNGVWNKSLKNNHLERITKNAHEIRGDDNYAIILGKKNTSYLLFQKPVRISKGANPFDNIKHIIGLPDKPATGYWFKKWFGDDETTNLLKDIVK